MSLRDILSRYWRGFQPELHEAVEETAGSLSDRYRLLLDVFEFVRVEKLIGSGSGPGRHAKHRVSLAHAFLAKAVFDLSSTRDLIERLQVDEKMRRLCRLVFGAGGSERGDLLACVRGVCREFLADPAA